MSIEPKPMSQLRNRPRHAGFTLIELVVFMVIIASALLGLLLLFNQLQVQSIDPISRVRALECATAKLDQISLRKFDQNTPVGGIPACGSGQDGAVACAGINPDHALDDVADFHGQVDNTMLACSIATTVVAATGEIVVTGISPATPQLRRITVVVKSGQAQLQLSRYKGNY